MCKKRKELASIVLRLEGGMGMHEFERTVGLLTAALLLSSLAFADLRWPSLAFSQMRAIKKNDRELETDTTNTIAGTFMVMAFAAFTGLTLIFVSYIFVAAQGDVVQATPADLGQTYKNVQRRPVCEIGGALADVEFLYMHSWAEFTSRCCCRDHDLVPNATSGGANASHGTLELWTCPDLSPANMSSSGLLHKLRTREVRNETTGEVHASGLHVRPFCSPDFALGVSAPTYDEELLAYVVYNEANGTVAESSYW